MKKIILYSLFCLLFPLQGTTMGKEICSSMEAVNEIIKHEVKKSSHHQDVWVIYDIDLTLSRPEFFPRNPAAMDSL